MRTVNQFATAESVRASLLTGGSGRNDTTQALVEFIVRADDGATLSIVQPNDADLRTGDRVLVERGDQTRLAPLR